jgi:hypothetical protein
MEKFTKENPSVELQSDTPVAQNEQPETPVVEIQPESNGSSLPKAPLWCRLTVIGLLGAGGALGLNACSHTVKRPPVATKITENEGQKAIQARSKGQAYVKLLRMVSKITKLKPKEVEDLFDLNVEAVEGHERWYKVNFKRKSADDWSDVEHVGWGDSESQPAKPESTTGQSTTATAGESDKFEHELVAAPQLTRKQRKEQARREREERKRKRRLAEETYNDSSKKEVEVQI